jgi:hypothetical protein
VNTSNVSDIIPVAASQAISGLMNQAFKSNLKVPKSANKYLVAKAVDRIVLAHESLEVVCHQMGLTQTEAEYIQLVAVEFGEWNMAAKMTGSTSIVGVS